MGRTIISMFISLFAWWTFINGNYAMECLSQLGKPVDWFILYKIPKLPSNKDKNIRDGTGFYYMDQVNPRLQLSSTGIDGTDHAVYYTLNQLYNNKTTMAYVMYNDQRPDNKNSSTHGHTKGVIGFDKTGGFWMVHSTPRFAPFRQNGYQWPPNGHTNGQAFLCISVDYPMDDLGSVLMYTYPYIYDMAFPNVFINDNPTLASVILSAGRTQKHIKSPPWYDIVKLKTSAGQVFLSFAKFTNFGRDLYDSLISQELKTNLLVQSWIAFEKKPGDRLPSNCTEPYKVYNINSTEFTDTDVTFSTSKDHSKWAVSKDGGNWLCIGDINRQKPQFHRGGGQVCFQHKDAWYSFRYLAKNVEECSHY